MIGIVHGGMIAALFDDFTGMLFFLRVLFYSLSAMPKSYIHETGTRSIYWVHC
jgi:hypothetical protein